MRLPAPLQPWAAWLAPFPDDLAAALGALLLRLDPLVGPLRRLAATPAHDPAGIGTIVRRGGYERLLISEWAYADAAPDEFLRRAANDELLFLGPEPAHSETPLRSVALFDAGPAQLGEPRLVHLAMFVLLARRAQAAGAEFRWGVLQRPGILHDDQGSEGVRRLLKARTHAVAGPADTAQWDAALDDDAHDCWLVGAPASPRPQRVRAHAQVSRSWHAEALDVVLAERGRNATVSLPLPPADDRVRLLRQPFDASGPARVVQPPSSIHSLKRAPYFGNRREWVAVGTVDGGMNVYAVPDSPRAKPGKPRQQRLPAHAESIVAAGFVQKSFCTIALRDGTLHFAGFPGPLFNETDKPKAAVPVPDGFHAVPGALNLASVFHMIRREGQVITERVFLLDKRGQLLCWIRKGQLSHKRVETMYRVLAENVIGAIQQGDKLLYAIGADTRTDAYALDNQMTNPQHLYPLMHRGTRFLFGDVRNWRGGRGMYALRLADDAWLVGENTAAERVTVARGDTVLGCARLDRAQPPGLVVLDAGRKHIMLVAGATRTMLVDSTERIAQASFDPAFQRLAWLGQNSTMLTVRGIDAAQPFLQTVARGGSHDG